MGKFLNREDYEEPTCPLSGCSRTERIPTERVLEKLDADLAQNDYAAAERHLRYWETEAKALGDRRGLLTLRNEQIGLCRKQGKKAEGMRAIDDTLSLLDEVAPEASLTRGTTLINAATGLKAFGYAERALFLYREAQRIYETMLDPDDERMAGLNNNTALTLIELKQYGEAEDLLRRAVEIMRKQEHGEAEEAISWLNLADLTAARDGEEQGAERIGEYLSRAETLLNTPDLPRDGDYAFVCEKCAPVFGYYGYFMTARELTSRAKEIYERA